MHVGIEWLVDAHGCVPGKLRDRGAVLAPCGELLGVREVTATEHRRGQP